MRLPRLSLGRPWTVLGAAVIVALATLLGSSAASAAGTPPPLTHATWQTAIKQLGVPSRGCFTASYPIVQWRKTQCQGAPHYPYPPAHGSHPAQLVGNGVDYSAEVSGSPLSSVTGTFDSITPGATETGQQFGAGPQVPNTFSLQLNAKPFSTPVCAGAGVPALCQGWQQFLYSTTYNQVFMQYWLLSYNTACPGGWFTYSFGATTDCYTNSSATALPGGVLTASSLPSTTMTGYANSGGTDSVVLSAPTGTATAVSADSLLDLAVGWTGVEFAVVGDCCGTVANFSAGTALAVRTITHNGTTAAPTCVYEGFTGETNNLNLTPTPTLAIGASPSMVSDQTSTPGVRSCATASGTGDTHLRTFRNLLYDYQAQGDSLEATTGPQFIVENRQVSGAPAWPSAAVNSAIAAQVGSAQVAVCTSPTRLKVNGATVGLASGGQLSLPGGGSVGLNGSTYTITGTSGDSVTATVNTWTSPTYIDLGVGLGRWPETVSGLMANAGTSVTSLATRTGTVLTAPFGFSDFYGNYVKSWRVSGSQDLLSTCGSAPAATNPASVFYSGNLPPQTEKQAQAACAAAGVKVAALLDACTVDEAVLGQHATDIYRSLPTDVTWGKISPPAGSP
jgi:hypothetical protein